MAAQYTPDEKYPLAEHLPAQLAYPGLIYELAAFALRHPDLEDEVLGLNAGTRRQFEQAKIQLQADPSAADEPRPENLAVFNEIVSNRWEKSTPDYTYSNE